MCHATPQNLTELIINDVCKDTFLKIFLCTLTSLKTYGKSCTVFLMALPCDIFYIHYIPIVFKMGYKVKDWIYGY